MRVIMKLTLQHSGAPWLAWFWRALSWGYPNDGAGFTIFVWEQGQDGKRACVWKVTG